MRATRFALVDSGLGVLPVAAQIRSSCPDATLILSMDPDGMPWGSRRPDDIAERLLRFASTALRYRPDVLICASNTGSVQALDTLRAAVKSMIPVIGTVPAIKSVAAAGEPVAVWATAATTASSYLAELVDRFARPGQVTRVACAGFADAVETGDDVLVAAAVADALARTPEHVRHIVLGCTQYELAAPWITAARPDLRLHGSAPAVTEQALQRAPRVLRKLSGNRRASGPGGCMCC